MKRNPAAGLLFSLLVLATLLAPRHTAASMAAASLIGNRARDIPILRKSANTYMFDGSVMERLEIKESCLPKGGRP